MRASAALQRGLSLTEQIVARHAVAGAGSSGSSSNIRSGSFVTVQPAHVMTHDNTAAVMEKHVSLISNIVIGDTCVCARRPAVLPSGIGRWAEAGSQWGFNAAN